MVVCFLTCLCFFAWIQRCTGLPVFNCPRPVAYGDSAVLKCSNDLLNIVILNNPDGVSVGGCLNGNCGVMNGMKEKVNITRIDNTVRLTVQTIVKEDDGEWTCQSGSETKTDTCFLNVYKLPSCEISSTSSLKGLTIGQDLTLNISFSDYYCTYSIAWNLHIGGRYQNITGLQDYEETDDITSRVITYSPVVTSSLTGRVELAYNCNDEVYDISCSGVEELKLRDPPSCKLTSVNDTEDLTTGSNLTLKAEIEEYPCTRGIEYALLIGSLMVTEFVKNNTSFYAKFEVKTEYLRKTLYLYYSCNNVSATTMTTGVEQLLNKGTRAQNVPSGYLALVIGLPVGVILLVAVLGILIAWQLKRCRPSNDDTPLYDVPNHDAENDNRYEDLIQNDHTRPHAQEIQNSPDVEYETPKQNPELQNPSSVQYENVENVEQTKASVVQYGNINCQSENGNQEYLSAVFERP